MATKTVFITSGTSFTVPSDFSSIVSIECIGGGGGSFYGTGSGGSGGGAYSKTTAITGLTANTAYTVQVGAGGTGGTTATSGGDTWFSNTGVAPTTASQGVLAKGGVAATTTTGDVRGTYVPATASDGICRTVMGILLPAIAVGPNATRVGALGVNQNLVS